jgi:hypothetical protein
MSLLLSFSSAKCISTGIHLPPFPKGILLHCGSFLSSHTSKAKKAKHVLSLLWESPETHLSYRLVLKKVRNIGHLSLIRERKGVI